MFSNLTIAILLGLGSSGWIYSRIQNKSGHNTRSSLIVAAVSGLAIVVIVTIILDMVFKK